MFFDTQRSESLLGDCKTGNSDGVYGNCAVTPGPISVRYIEAEHTLKSPTRESLLTHLRL